MNCSLILFGYANAELQRLEQFTVWLVHAVAAEDAPQHAAPPLLEGFSMSFVLFGPVS